MGKLLGSKEYLKDFELLPRFALREGAPHGMIISSPHQGANDQTKE